MPVKAHWRRAEFARIAGPCGGPRLASQSSPKESPPVTSIVTALAAVGALTAALATLLVAANRKLHVEEDPRIDDVEEMLPGTNCGACGAPGCRAFAESLVAGDEAPAGCTVSADAARQAIAVYLGVDVGTADKRIARLACAGGNNVARNRAHYNGLSSCAAAAVVAGGGKGCSWGCLGIGDCADVCDFDAIHMNEHDLPVVDADLCTACGDCVDACPKDLFSLQPVSHQVWVACRSLEAGDAALADCDVACDACGRCAMDAPDLVTMVNNLPVVDYKRPQKHAAIERCPTGAIVWLDDGRIERGPAAKKIIREQPRPPAPS
jgi:Na+-translocating ferredoxin:NAD+ oxidoreductase RNF subunit RnfB